MVRLFFACFAAWFAIAIAACGGADIALSTNGSADASVDEPADAAIVDAGVGAIEAATPSVDADVPALAPVDVPMTVGTVASGSMRFSVSVQIGDAPPFQAQIDTGSAGLRILPGMVPDSAFESITTTVNHETYGGSLTVNGVVAMAKVKIGGAATSVSIPVQLIQTEACTSANPGCSVTAEVASHFSGFSAILGLGMRTATVAPVVGNPIAQMPGSPSFIISAPPFPGGAGILRIAPSAAELGLFKTFNLSTDSTEVPLQNGVVPWNDLSTPACVTDVTDGTQYCAGVHLDTGESPTKISWPDYSGSTTTFASGKLMDFTIDPISSPLCDYSFTVGATPKAGLDEVHLAPTTSGKLINSGTAPFFRYDILFDQAHGILGFSPH
jgi:hypothetical protein